MSRWLLSAIAFAVGLVIVPVGVFFYLSYGRPPVSVSDSPFAMEEKMARTALHRRIDSEMKTSPLEATPETLLAGAVIYRENCAFCHGVPGEKSKIANQMYPSTPQLWQPHRGGVVGVSDDPVGETFWRVKNGIRLTGMPSYQHLLTEEQMWQVSLLLSKANEPASDQVNAALARK